MQKLTGDGEKEHISGVMKSWFQSLLTTSCTPSSFTLGNLNR